jgi:hypothetical protein
MTATALLSELHDAGIRVEVRGDRLHVECKRGAFTPEIRARLVERKAELLAGLGTPTVVRKCLQRIAEADRIDSDIVRNLHDDDIAACVGLPVATLRDYLRAQDFARMMDRGIPPPGYSKAVECSGCGPVLLWQSSPDRVIACPWCFRRKAGKPIPRPTTELVPAI